MPDFSDGDDTLEFLGDVSNVIGAGQRRQQLKETQKQNRLLQEINRRQRAEDAKPECPRCRGKITANASVCQHCTVELLWCKLSHDWTPFVKDELLGGYGAVIESFVDACYQASGRVERDLRSYEHYIQKASRQSTAMSRVSLARMERMVQKLDDLKKFCAYLGLNVPARADATISDCRYKILGFDEKFDQLDKRLAATQRKQYLGSLCVLALILATTVFGGYAFFQNWAEEDRKRLAQVEENRARSLAKRAENERQSQKESVGSGSTLVEDEESINAGIAIQQTREAQTRAYHERRAEEARRRIAQAEIELEREEERERSAEQTRIERERAAEEERIAEETRLKEEARLAAAPDYDWLVQNVTDEDVDLFLLTSNLKTISEEELTLTTKDGAHSIEGELVYFVNDGERSKLWLRPLDSTTKIVIRIESASGRLKDSKAFELGILDQTSFQRVSAWHKKMLIELELAAKLRELKTREIQASSAGDDGQAASDLTLSPPSNPDILPQIAEAPFDARQASAYQRALAKHLGQDIEIENSISMKLNLIPAGTFVMGAASNNFTVNLTEPFRMGIYEVTQDQYEKVMGENPSVYKVAQNPVQQVSWNDAVEFCRKLSQLPAERTAGRVYRLPTEAEWEYACRAGTATAYHNGNTETHLASAAWYSANSGSTIHAVGGKSPNGWGLYDMHGNVWEWCRDWYGEYPSSEVTDPVGPSTGSTRVSRGGGFSYNALNCRSDERKWGYSGHRSQYGGFRVVMDIVAGD